MTRTFLVALNLDDASMLDDVAGDIEDDLVKSGHDVISVHPWMGHVDPQAQFAALPTPTQQAITTTPPAEPPPMAPGF